MWLPDNSTWSAKFRWVEVARYVPNLDRVIREKRGDKPVLLSWDDAIAYADRHNREGIYTSVFRYDTINLDEATRFGNLYFDFDHAENPELAYQDVRKLHEYLREFIPRHAVHIYFTGAKGFHLEVEAVTLGVAPSNDLAAIYRYIATQLKDKLQLSTLDFSVYDLRRMWRMPYTKHQKTGLYKIELDDFSFYRPFDHILRRAKNGLSMKVEEQKFDARANEWYREWLYKRETKTYTTEALIERFNKLGTAITRKATDDELVFDPVELFNNCHSILDLWKTAEEEHHLSHEARLFLCSILTYNEEARWYLHEILRHCEDYDQQKSQSHIDDWIRRRELGIGGRPFSCERANSAGVGCGDCDLKPKARWERVGDRIVETGEEALPSPIRFAYRRKISDE